MAFRIALLFVLLTACTAKGVEPQTFDPPVRVAVTLPAEPADARRVIGGLSGIDDDGMTLVVNGEERQIAWADVSPSSAFLAVMRARGQPTDADDWITLIVFGRDIGAEQEAARAASRARRLAPDREADIDAALARPLNTLRGFPPAEIVPDTDAALPEVEVLTPPEQELPPKFLPVTPEAAAEAERLAEVEALDASKQLNLRLRQVYTPHFVIYTDWDPIDDAWLTARLEDAYALLAREFHVAEDDTVFVGRMPVYMFHSSKDMIAYAREFDRFEASDTVAGYHTSRPGGLNKLVMSKPSATNQVGLQQARIRWARTLTHEFVHAFLARYRGERHIPRWMNEGLAEMLAENVMQRPNAIETARQFARSNDNLERLFDDSYMPGAELYPVMYTMTAALYHEDPARFVQMVDRIKAGEETEALLQELYGVNYEGLVQAWRNYLR